MIDPFDSAGLKVQVSLGVISEHALFQSRFPRLASSLRELATALYEIERTAANDFTGLDKIPDDRIFQAQARDRLMNAILATPTGLPK